MIDTDKPALDPSEFTVLVVDDEESIRAILGEAVGSWGFQVATAPNGEAAWDYMNAGNLPHVLLSDIRMGGMSGLELAKKLKEVSPETEVIIMTSHGSLEYALQAMKIGVFDFLTKPFDNIEDVRTVLMHVCERIHLRQYSSYLMEEVKRKNFEIEGLAEVSRQLASTLDPRRVLDIAAQGISKAFEDAPTLIMGFDPSRGALQTTSRYPQDLFSGTLPSFPFPSELQKNEAKLLKHFEALNTDNDFKQFLIQAEKTSPQFFNREGYSWKVGVILIRGKAFGVVALYTSLLDADSREAWSLLERYMQTLSTQYDNAIMHSRAVESSIKDGLTGLYNVRYFKERFDRELKLALRHQIPMCVLFMDVDHFKKYNDSNGHPAGDQVLRMMGQLLRENFRSTEVIARYGGEEFVVLMFHCLMSGALIKAERFRQAVEATAFPHGEKQPLGKVTVSIGVSEFPRTATSMAALIQGADDALYAAKAKGRNVVVQGKSEEGYIAPFKVDPDTVKSKL